MKMVPRRSESESPRRFRAKVETGSLPRPTNFLKRRLLGLLGPDAEGNIALARFAADLVLNSESQRVASGLQTVE